MIFVNTLIGCLAIWIL